jgi:hypothetical protein
MAIKVNIAIMRTFVKLRKAIRDNEYEKRLPHILEARRRVMEEYNFFAVLSREIEQRHNDSRAGVAGSTIYSRHLLRKNSPGVAVRDFWGKSRLKLRSLLQGS